MTAVALLAAGTTALAGWPTPGAGTGPAGRRVTSPAGSAELVSYTGCGQLLSSLKAQALAQVGPFGLSGGFAYEMPGAVRYGT